MSKKTKAIRFSESEEKLINEFLKKNPLFDFSTLARTSILQFMERPELIITPVSRTPKKVKELR